MPNQTITQHEVIARTAGLPSFPRVVAEIMSSLDDPDSNLAELSGYIAHDPVIAARVLSVANRAADHHRPNSAIRDIYTATSMIGMSQVRQITLLSSIGQFTEMSSEDHLPATYWTHSVAVGVCAQELAIHVEAPISSDAALIAGLLHDIGQLWLFRFKAEAFGMVRDRASTLGVDIEIAEKEIFGVDHSQIGAWLAEHWDLPEHIVAAIRHHHHPGSTPKNLLIPTLNIAETLASALDLGGRKENKVKGVSAAACSALGLVFNREILPLFGRIEARSRYANALFASTAG